MKNEYEVRGKVTVIFLGNLDERLEVMIDSSDFEIVNSVSGTWYATAVNSSVEKCKNQLRFITLGEETPTSLGRGGIAHLFLRSITNGYMI